MKTLTKGGFKKLYTNQAVEKLVDKYIQAGGEIIVKNEGCLLEYGLAIFTGEKLKSAIIKEVYINEWSSGYSIRFFNKIPKKYANI